MINGILDIDRVVAGRTFGRIGRRVELVETTTSTNDHIWSFLCGTGFQAVELADGSVVFAEHQSAGRGRMGRSWTSPRGASVMFSTLLVDSPDAPTPPAEVLGLLAGIATARAVNQITAIHAQIAWPNDIVVGNRKLAGILIESRTVPPPAGGRLPAGGRQPVENRCHSGRRAYAVGIGINCLQHRNHFPAELRSRATSIDLESNAPVDREAVAGAVLANLDAWLCEPAKWDAPSLKAAFVECALPFGRRIRLRYHGEEYCGQVVDLDPSAALVVQLDTGGRRLFPAAGTTVIDGPAGGFARAPSPDIGS